MHICKSCESELPDNASFCGACGYTSVNHDDRPTEIHEVPLGQASDVVTTLKTSPLSTQQNNSSSDAMTTPMATPLVTLKEGSVSDAITIPVATPPATLKESSVSDAITIPTATPLVTLKESPAPDAITTLMTSPLTPQQDKSSSDAVTILSASPLTQQQESSHPDAVTTLSTQQKDIPFSDAITALKTSPLTAGSPQQLGGPTEPELVALIDLPEEAEEEERRIVIPLPVDSQLPNNAPVVQGTPQLESTPTVPGTPHPLGGATSGGRLVLPPPPEQSSLPSSGVGSQPASGTLSPPSSGTGSAQGTGSFPQPKPKPSNPGCFIWLAIVIVSLTILASIFSAAFIVFTPALTLSGGTNVVIGESFHLHGSNFIQGSTVTLTLDNGIPLFYTSRPASQSIAYTGQSDAVLGAFTQYIDQIPNPQHTVKVSSNGTFNVSIAVDRNWHVGRHTIKATESLSARSAISTFNVFMPGQMPTPSATAKPKASPSPSATTTQTALNSINPSMISFGPISEGYNQALSQQVILNTTGTKLLTWTATWDTNQAPWLQLNIPSGQIQAPNSQLITVSALAANLKAGNYATTVTFSSPQSTQHVKLNVAFTVQAGCVSVTPGTLTFTGVAGVSDPAAQTVTLKNCGATGTWSESVQTAANWLSVSPTSGNLRGGATQTVTVSAAILSTQLPAGTYQSQITFMNGSGKFAVSVTLIVQPAPILTVSPTTLDENANCTLNPNTAISTCFVSLSSSQTNQSNLNWSSPSNGTNGLTINPATGTLQPGQTIRVEIDITGGKCPDSKTITFKGPANQVDVTWSCVLIP